MKLIQHLFQKPFIIFFLTLPLLAVGCKKDITEKIDITEYEWELQHVDANNGGKLSVQNKDYLRDDAYVLNFNTDSTFSLYTSVNVAKGNYEIPQQGDISVHSYTAITEVGTTDEDVKKLNKNLIRVFNAVTSYEVFGGLNKTLVFDGPKGKVKFEKK